MAKTSTTPLFLTRQLIKFAEKRGYVLLKPGKKKLFFSWARLASGIVVAALSTFSSTLSR
ncbi:hypothetical protein BCL90_5289 [Pedobacter alluvionis]|uniref:Uncharacterized protein n=1 Tax=Pedobacter alluvionis TaxID=475253 RepID=A0A497XKX4_9SPHI|nr:hypothetical protein BCL90_5289 [Pedobacter alluvionis]